jgi:hypothetical protein
MQVISSASGQSPCKSAVGNCEPERVSNRLGGAPRAGWGWRAAWARVGRHAVSGLWREALLDGRLRLSPVARLEFESVWLAPAGSLE